MFLPLALSDFQCPLPSFPPHCSFKPDMWASWLWSGHRLCVSLLGLATFHRPPRQLAPSQQAALLYKEPGSCRMWPCQVRGGQGTPLNLASNWWPWRVRPSSKPLEIWGSAGFYVPGKCILRKFLFSLAWIWQVSPLYLQITSLLMFKIKTLQQFPSRTGGRLVSLPAMSE